MVTGGTSPYTYQWLDGSSVLSTDSVVIWFILFI